jgi:quercetin 2,3-dioxygenase
MIERRAFAGLGGAKRGWLDTRHHFSFSNYQDPDRIQWGHLRVWNDDIIAANSGFPPHPHRDMEIITYVLEGAISHGDNLGNEGRTEAGNVQVMSAGTGIEHSEFNREAIPTWLFQIWILPDQHGGPPNWATRPFPRQDRLGRFTILASGRPEQDDALPIRADARVAAVSLPAGESAEYEAALGRHLYLVPARGAVEVNGIRIEARDGAAAENETRLRVTALEAAEVILVDTV